MADTKYRRRVSSPYAIDGPYTTELSPEDEEMFGAWVRYEKIPFDMKEQDPDYDMRGFWKDMTTGVETATSGIDPYDGKLHFTDYYKTPTHKTFSRESKYATKDAPGWSKDGRYLLDNNGKILFDATQQQ